MKPKRKFVRRALSPLLSLLLVLASLPFAAIPPAQAFYYQPSLAEVLTKSGSIVNNAAVYWSGLGHWGAPNNDYGWLGKLPSYHQDSMEMMGYAMDSTGKIWEMAQALYAEVENIRRPTARNSGNNNYEGAPLLYYQSLSGNSGFAPTALPPGIMQKLRGNLREQGVNTGNFGWLLGLGDGSEVNNINDISVRPGIMFGNAVNNNFQIEPVEETWNGSTRVGGNRVSWGTPVTGLTVHMDLKAALRLELRKHAVCEVDDATGKILSVSKPADLMTQFPTSLALTRQIIARYDYDESTHGTYPSGYYWVRSVQEMRSFEKYENGFYASPSSFQSYSAGNLAYYRDILDYYRTKVYAHYGKDLSKLSLATLDEWYQAADYCLAEMTGMWNHVSAHAWEDMGPSKLRRNAYDFFDPEIFMLLGLEGSVNDLALWRNQLFNARVNYYTESANWFHHPVTGKMESGNTTLFNDFPNVWEDPRPVLEQQGFDLTGMEALLIEARQRHQAFREIYLGADPVVTSWLAQLQTKAQGLYNLGPALIDAQAGWIDNLSNWIALARLHSLKDEAQWAMGASVNYREGVETGPGNYKDSDYTHAFAQIANYHDILAVTISHALYLRDNPSMAGTYAGVIDAVFPPAYLDALIARRDALATEMQYRRTLGCSEEVWYTYRDYYMPLLTQDWSSMGSGEIARKIDEILQKQYEHRQLYDQAVAALGQTLADEIYGDFGDVIVWINHYAHVGLAAKVTQEVSQAMDIVNAAEAQGLADIDLRDAQRNLRVLSWQTFSLLKQAIDQLEPAAMQRLADSGVQSWLGSGDYTWEEVLDDYTFLKGAVMDVYNQFLNDPAAFVTRTTLPDLHRAPMEDDLAGSPPHDFTDAGKAGLTQLIGQLDKLLGPGGDIKPLLSALDQIEGFDFDWAQIGVDLAGSGPAVLGDVVDKLFADLLYNDKFINRLVDMVYPKALDALEIAFRDNVANINIADFIGPAGAMILNPALRVKSIYELLNSGPFSGIKLYPDMLGRNITDGEFAEVRHALTQAVPQNHTNYPTNVWSMEATPSLYDETGTFNLHWYIDKDKFGNERSPSEKKRLFKKALAEVFGGALPVLQAVLLNRETTLANPEIGRFTAKAQYLSFINVNSPLDLKLTFAGSPGLSSVFYPIFEALLGTELDGVLKSSGALVPGSGLRSLNDLMTGPATASALVDYIMGPIDGILEKIKKKPVSELLSLLPNLSFALTLDRVLPLLNNLEVSIKAQADATVDLLALFGGSGLKFKLSDVTNPISFNISPINVGEMLQAGGGFDLGILRDPNALLGALLGPLGVPAGQNRLADPFNFGRLSTYGSFVSSTAPGLSTYRAAVQGGVVQYPATRHYILSDKAAVLQELLTWLLGSGLLPLNITGVNDAAAAIAELAKPKAYTPDAVTYGAPLLAQVQYPSWWADETVARDAARYLADNADTVLDILWKVLVAQDTAPAFAQGVRALLEEQLVSAGAFETLAAEIKNLLRDKSLRGFLEEYGGLLSRQLLIGGAPLEDIAGILEDLLAFDAAEAAQDITGLESFADALVAFLAPICPLLDVLLSGAGVELLNAGDDTGLVKVNGYNGYTNGILPILKAFADPLEGIVLPTQTEIDALDGEGKLRAILAVLTDVFGAVLEQPVTGLLNLLPNLAYFLSEDADGGESPMQQSLDALLHPLYVAVDTLRPFRLFQMQRFTVDGIAMIDTALSRLLASANLPLTINLRLADLLLGERSGTMLEADQPAVLLALLNAAGLEGYLEANGLSGLVSLLRQEKGDGPAPIDYTAAPGPAEVTPPKWLTQPQADFLADNADGVLNWAWNTLIAGNNEGKAWLEGLIKSPVHSTLEATAQGLFGTYLYTKDNLITIAGLVMRFKAEQLDTITIPAMDALGAPAQPLKDVLPQLVSIYDEARDIETQVDLDKLFKGFADYLAAPAAVSGEGEFRAALNAMLLPMMPLLRVFLAESNVLLIKDDAIVGGEDGAFLRFHGYDGYRTGLLPLLAGLGADVPGFLDTLLPYEDDTAPDFKSGTETEQIAAILDPVVFLLDAFTKDPIAALMRLLPNAAYLLSGAGGNSILQQAVDNILYPAGVVLGSLPALDAKFSEMVTLNAGERVNALLAELLAETDIKPFRIEDLIVGKVTVFDEPWSAMGKGGEASYINTAGFKDDFLVQLLGLLGAFDFLQDKNLAGLVSLLNTVQGPGPGPAGYPDIDTRPPGDLYRNCFWTKRQAREMANRAGGFIDDISTLLFGKPLGKIVKGKAQSDSYLQDLIGENLYTQENFNALLDLIQRAIPEIEDIQVVPGTALFELLAQIVEVGGEKINVIAILDHLRTWKPEAEIKTQQAFFEAMMEYLEPAMPLLDFLLAGEDIVVLSGIGENGLLKANGYDGYRYGIVPIYEAILVPLNAQSQITPPDDYKQADTQGKLEALLWPVLFTLDALVARPADHLLLALPNLMYFINEEKGPSLLQQSLDRVTYAIGDILGPVLGKETQGSLIVPDVNGLLEDLLASLGYPGINMQLLRSMCIGTLTPYDSLSGGAAKYVKVTRDDIADMLTVLMRTLFGITRSKEVREQLLGLLGLSSFTKFFVRLRLDWTFFWYSLFGSWGTDFALRKTSILIRLLMFLMPVLKLFFR